MNEYHITKPLEAIGPRSRRSSAPYPQQLEPACAQVLVDSPVLVKHGGLNPNFLQGTTDASVQQTHESQSQMFPRERFIQYYDLVLRTSN